MMKRLLCETLPVELKNKNNGQGHSYHSSAKDRKNIERKLRELEYNREPFSEKVNVVVTRILGPRQKMWDPSSILRGNYKQIEDSLVALGWWHDDSAKWIGTCDGRQDDTQRANGPALKIEIFQNAKPDMDLVTRSNFRGDGIEEAWQIINVLNMSEMDRGESWPRANKWLNQWGDFAPTNHQQNK